MGETGGLQQQRGSRYTCLWANYRLNIMEISDKPIAPQRSRSIFHSIDLLSETIWKANGIMPMPIPLPLTLPLRPPHKNHPLQAKQIFGWFLRWGGPGPPSFSIFCLPESIDKCIYANVDLDLDHKSSKLKMLSKGFGDGALN